MSKRIDLIGTAFNTFKTLIKNDIRNITPLIKKFVPMDKTEFEDLKKEIENDYKKIKENENKN